MKRLVPIVALCGLFIQPLLSQTPTGGVPGTTNQPQTSTTGTAPYSRPVSWKQLLPNIGDDQREIWTFPTRLNKKRVLIPTLAVVAVAGALIVADPLPAQHFRNNQNDGFTSTFNGSATGAALALAPAALYFAGLKKHDSWATNTALLTGQAVADSEIVDLVLKRAFSRARPRSLPDGTKFGDTWFEEHKGWLNGNGGFPSGHAVAAFSIATVMAHRYSNHKWVPWVAYGAAGFVAFSRLPDESHFSSDIFMGAALGYSISRFTVLRH